MICYKDKTFCGYWKDCKIGKSMQCGRELTEDIEARAEKVGLPLCQFAEKPICFDSVSVKTKKKVKKNK